MYRSKYKDSAFTVKGRITFSFKNTKHGEGVGYSSKFLQDPDSCSQKNLKPNGNMISARICIHAKKSLCLDFRASSSDLNAESYGKI